MLTDVRFPARRALRHLGRARHRGHAVLRSAARQDHRARRRRAPRRVRALRRRRSPRRRFDGIETNLDYLRAGRSPTPSFARGGVHHAASCSSVAYRPRRDRGARAGHADDRAGLSRAALGYWDVGVPPSGRWTRSRSASANRLVGNAERRAGARVHADRPDAALPQPTPSSRSTGADMAATLDGAPVPRWRAVRRAGRVGRCALGRVHGGRAARAYLAVRGGIDVPRLPRQPRRRSRSGSFGGHGGRALRAGDVLHAGDSRRRRLRRRRAAERRCVPALRERVGDRRALRSARRARLLHRRRHRRRSSRRDVEGALQLRPHRRAPDRPEAALGAHATAARPACTRRTSTTTPTPSARSTSPATCRSSSAPTARASAASSARRRSSQAELWKIGQLRPGDTRALRRRVAGRGAAAPQRAGARASTTLRRRRRRAPPGARPTPSPCSRRRAERGGRPAVVYRAARRPLPARRVRRRSCSTSPCASASTR